MAVEHGPARSRRDELSVVPGEDLRTWAERVRRTAVMHPDLLAQERARQDEARDRRVRWADRWLIASLLLLVAFVILHQVADLSWWLVVVSAAAVAGGVAGTARASQMRRSGAAITAGASLRRNQVVRLIELDGPCRAQLERPRQAIAEALSSLDDHESLPDLAADAAILREYEWTLAVVLRKFTQLRAKYDADPTAEPDEDARRILETGQEGAAALARSIEGLATQLKATSNAHKRSQRRDRSGRLNDDALDFAALMEADVGPAIEQIRESTERLAELQKYCEGETGDTSG